MIGEPDLCDSRGLVAMAKSIGDLDDLIKLLSKGLSRAKPWQQRLAAQLSEMDRLLQVLRLTIALERSDAEILAAARDLRAACRQTSSTASTTRADQVTKASLRLAADLSTSLLQAMERRPA